MNSIPNWLSLTTCTHTFVTLFWSTKKIDLWHTLLFLHLQNKLQKEGVFDALRRDFIVAFSKWDFDPLDMTNPYPKNESSVHIWQGYEDKVVPVQLQRFVSRKLPWIQYHEVPDGGHLLVHDTAVCEAIMRSLLLGEDPPLYRPTSVN